MIHNTGSEDPDFEAAAEGRSMEKLRVSKTGTFLPDPNR